MWIPPFLFRKRSVGNNQQENFMRYKKENCAKEDKQDENTGYRWCRFYRL